MASEALSIEGVDTYYGDSHVLHGVGFALRAGGLLGLLGRNGAGKTTCMSTIMGFLKPRRGAISLYGEPVAGLAPDLCIVAASFDAPPKALRTLQRSLVRAVSGNGCLLILAGQARWSPLKSGYRCRTFLNFDQVLTEVPATA